MNFFIVGAGLTKALFPDAPLNDDLFYTISNEKIEKDIQFLEKKYNTSDIEIALTMLDLDIAKSLKTNEGSHSKLVNIRKNIECSLFSFFSKFNVNDDLLT